MDESRPLEESYWVLPGMLMAGEYPGNNDPSTARDRLRRLIEAGVTRFVDLTRPGELAPYAEIADEIAGRLGRRVRYSRFGIPDVSVPDRPDLMQEVLDTIDRETESGGMVYVHCWGGVGRTGIAVGSYLVRRGFDGEQALARLADLFADMPKSRRKNGSPETEEQRRFIRDWVRVDRAKRGPTLRSRYRGALLGLAAGDALGTTLEFRSPGSFEPISDIVGGGPFRLKAGEWTDDTAMALCSAASLVDLGRFDERDHMDRFVRWWKEGAMSCTGTCFDIGSTVRGALIRYLETGDPVAGPTAPHTAGNGSLMRIAPVVLWAAGTGCELFDVVRKASRLTHGAPQAVDACAWFAALLEGFVRGMGKEEVPAHPPETLVGCAHPLEVCPEIAEVMAGSYRTKEPPEIRGTGYVRDSLEAALWAFDRSADFREGALRAVNLGNDADTTGAVFGQLAGAWCGEEGIPPAWLATLAWRDRITALADGLFRGRRALAA